MSQENEKLNIKNKSVLLAVMMLLLVSYAAVPFPHYGFSAKETNTNGTVISSTNSYVLLKDGKYFLVTNKFPIKELSKEHALIMLDGGIELKEE